MTITAVSANVASVIAQVKCGVLEQWSHGRGLARLPNSCDADMADWLVAGTAAPDSLTNRQALALQIPCIRATCRSDGPTTIWQ